MDQLEEFDTVNSTDEVGLAQNLMTQIEAYATGELIQLVTYSLSDGAGGTLSVGNTGYQRGTSVYPTTADAVAMTNGIAIGTAVNEAIVTATGQIISSARPESNERVKRLDQEFFGAVEYFEGISALETYQQTVNGLTEQLRRIIDPDNCLGPWHGYTRVYAG